MQRKHSSLAFGFLALALVLGLLLACSPTASPAPSSPAATVWTPDAPASAAATQAPPAAATSTTTAADAPAGQTTVRIFLIAVGDNGQSGSLIGCGDSAVPVQVTIPATQAVLRAALIALLSLDEEYYGQSGLYNALYTSDLQVETVTIESGTAIINLSGALALGGECDSPRVQSQIEETALQFSTVKRVLVFLNGKALEDVLSLKG